MSIYCREPRNSLIFTGPPYDIEKDEYYANEFIEFDGAKAIVGGTTANIVSRELNLPVRSGFSVNVGKLPDVLLMDGVDLVTEGILTLTKTSDYLESGICEDDSAGKLMKFMLDSDCINFMVGARVNQAHYDPSLPIEIEIRKNIVRKIAKILETKYLKKVRINFI